MNNMPQSIWVYFAIAGIAGVVGGWLFHRIWRRLLPSDQSKAFWRNLPGDVQAMFTTMEPSDVLRLYGQILKGVGSYVGRILGATLLGILPTAVMFYALTELDPSSELADSIGFCPGELVGEPGSTTALANCANGLAITVDGLPDRMEIAGYILDREQLEHKQILCTGTVNCFLYEMLLFKTRVSAIDTSLVIRPCFFDRNPLWPVLNDLDLFFFIVTMLGSAASAWRVRADKVLAL